MLATPLILAGLLTAEVPVAALETPARGSVPGPWALVDLGVKSETVFSTMPYSGAPPSLDGNLDGDLSVVGGLGFAVKGVRLSPTARFSLGPRVRVFGGPKDPVLTWSSLALAVAAPDLLNGVLRLTPVLGVTVPTTPAAFAGTEPLTTVFAALQVEKRLGGSFELSWRLQGNHGSCRGPDRRWCLVSWELGQRLFVEGWVLPSLSVALGATWSMSKLVIVEGPRPGGCVAAAQCDQAGVQVPRNLFGSEALVTWAFSPLVGATLALGASYAPSPAVFIQNPTPGQDGPTLTTLHFGISVWLRTDQLLTRNWLDR